MASYKFECIDCDITWEEVRPIQIDPMADCPKCLKKCKNIAFGGTGFQFSGKQLNDRLGGFPDHTRKTLDDAEKDNREFERSNDSVLGKMGIKTNMEGKVTNDAAKVSAQKRANRSKRFRQNP